MSIQLTCPSGHTLTIADTWAGRAGRCPVCKAPVQVPVAVSVPPVDPTPTPAEIRTVGAARTHDSIPPSALEATPQKVPQRPESKPASAPRLTDRPASAPSKSVSVNVASTSSDAPRASRPPPPLPAHSLREELNPAAVDSVVAEINLSRFMEGKVARPQSGAAQANVAAPPQITAPPMTTLPPPLNGPSGHLVAPGSESPNALEPVRHVIEPTLAPATTIVAAASSALGLKVSSERAPDQRHMGYRFDSDKRWTVYYLAVAMAALSLFSMIPALPHWNLAAAPAWARAVWLLSLLQLAYVVWVASIPDWATLWSSMIVYTVVAALYGLTMMVALTTPVVDIVPLDLTDLRRQAVLWCLVVVLLACLLAYFCGRAAWRWRRTLELLHL
jgi:hypothetical protein